MPNELKLVVMWTCVSVFVLSAAITILALLRVIKLPNQRYMNKLFAVIIVAVAGVCVSFFGDSLNNPKGSTHPANQSTISGKWKYYRDASNLDNYDFWDISQETGTDNIKVHAGPPASTYTGTFVAETSDIEVRIMWSGVLSDSRQDYTGIQRWQGKLDSGGKRITGKYSYTLLPKDSPIIREESAFLLVRIR